MTQAKRAICQQITVSAEKLNSNRLNRAI